MSEIATLGYVLPLTANNWVLSRVNDRNQEIRKCPVINQTASARPQGEASGHPRRKGDGPGWAKVSGSGT